MEATKSITGDFGDLGLRLLHRGWGVFPADAGKATTIRWKKYQRRQPYELEVLAWQRTHPSAGVALPFGPVNDHVVGIDLDEDEPMAAAFINEVVDAVLGPSPIIRVGRWPRTLRLYRGKKLPSTRIGEIDVLGRGHYGLAYGVHPTTGEPYRHVGQATLLDLRPKDLPCITLKHLERLRLELEDPSASPVWKDSLRPRIGKTGLTVREALQGVTLGRRHAAMFCIASGYRGMGRPKDNALNAVHGASRRCTPPYPLADAESVVHWVYAKLPPGLPGDDVPRILRVAWTRAIASPHPIDRGSLKYRCFLAMCADLQLFRGSLPIALPQIVLSKTMSCTHQAVSKMIRQAVGDGLLRIADSAYEKRHRAKTYWFDGASPEKQLH